MKKTVDILPVPVADVKEPKRCLSCGATEHLGRRRYCSIDCRQKLRQRLDMRIGLLQALNTRYATFYFSDLLIIMDVLPHGYKEICSFFYPRTPGKNPGEDFGRMADILGETWWAEQRRTKKRYFATLHVLNRAARNRVPPQAVKPKILHTPDVRPASLVYLNLEKSNLDSPELRKIIRDAYRRQAKIHHPDLGGDAVMFRKIHQAYEDLIRWAENPIFIRHRGFSDKWFYEGDKERWAQPTPIHPRGR
ncbi:MAG: J domain-containing protein [Deltaproteobacteria bacterium]|nr:J domain-containing protein [Deltaproteobacteria bacterium]